ncbi:TolC family protein [Candidatus Enterovibrio altilux]|uniref:TolC family protein n=1 Tax=Candidatus Enterovibrio altilux TaxID=1927128 RepID=UPI001F39A9B7|nr:TolC family protein [Candidatus Enterovibrio luxaltus]
MTIKYHFQRNALTITVITLCSTLTFPIHAITMQQAWEAAKAFDPTYSQAQIQSQISEIQVRSTKNMFLPSASINASASRDADGKDTQSYSAILIQPIWDSTYWTQLDQHQAEYVASQLKVKVAYNQLASSLLYAYLNLASAQGDLQLAEQKFAEGARLLNVTEQRYKAGKLQSIALENMRANHIDEQAFIFRAQATLKKRKTALAALINQDVQHINQIKTTNLSEPPMRVNNELE